MANLVEYGINSIPISGRFLAHNGLDPAGRAFLAADLFIGAKQPVNLMMTQSAYLARVNITYAWWAFKRRAERASIEAGLVPLVPARANGNGRYGPPSRARRPILTEIDDAELAEMVRMAGVDRTLAAAVQVESCRSAS